MAMGSPTRVNLMSNVISSLFVPEVGAVALGSPRSPIRSTEQLHQLAHDLVVVRAGPDVAFAGRVGDFEGGRCR